MEEIDNIPVSPRVAHIPFKNDSKMPETKMEMLTHKSEHEQYVWVGDMTKIFYFAITISQYNGRYYTTIFFLNANFSIR